MLFTVVMIRLRFNTFRSESPEGGTAKFNCADGRARAAEIYEAFANESMPCDEPWPKKGAWRSSSD
jgi:hypothetical protein